MTSDTDKYQWNRQQVQVPLLIGEVCLWRPFFDGVRSTPDIFSTPPLSSLDPPVEAMGREDVHLATAYSAPLAPGVRRVSRRGTFLCVVSSLYRHYYVETKGEFGQYALSKKRKTISTLKRKIKKIDATNGGEDSFAVYASPRELEEFFALALPVSRKSFQHRLLGQGLEVTQEFQDEIIAKGAKGEVLGFILRVDGKPVAYNLCPMYGGNKILYDDTGYDPDYAAYSPGTVLQYKMIEELFRRKDIDYYDLCTGEGIHKEMFATGHIYCGNIYFSSLMSWPSILVIVNFTLLHVTKFIKKILEVFGLKGIVKKKIRSAAR